MTPLERLGESILKLLAVAVGKVGHASAIPMLSVAESLLSLVSSKRVEDIRFLRSQLKRRSEARTIALEAEAKRTIAEAKIAANEADLPRRRDALARQEKRAKELENSKTEAEIQQIKQRIENEQLTAKTEAVARLLESISAIRQAGGDVFFSEENLADMLQLPPPEAKPDDEDEHA